MAKIDKMQLQGIRSFGPHETDRQNVEFFSPLTLILGQNGCGKTTIIECLKYVTTGDVPPGSKNGQSFVHDPKMAHETTVKGQVKLLFKGLDGKDKIISRSLEATQKTKGITVKTMDTTMTTRLPNNKYQQISSKCADMNAEMFVLLGVSKPILNYVIFCHQEDSNWPLEEGKKVKEKFDEIFNSAKYRSCQTNIKEVRKKEMEEMRADGNNMKHYREDRDMCRQKKGDLKRKIRELEGTETEVDTLTKDTKPIEAKYREVLEEEKGYSHLQSRVTEANTKLEYARRERSDLQNKITEILPDSVDEDEIQRRLRKMDQAGEETRRRTEDVKARLEAYKLKERNLEHKIQKNAAYLGQLVSDKTRFDKELKERSQVLEDAQDILAINIDPDVFKESLQKEQDKISSQIRRMKLERRELEEQYTEAIDALKQERTALEEKKKRSLSDLAETKSQTAKLKRELIELEGCGSKLERLKADWETKTKELQEKRSRVDLEALQTSIGTMKGRLHHLDNKEEELKLELVELEKNQALLQKEEYLTTDINEKETRRKKTMNKRNSVLLDIFSTIPDFKRLRKEFKEEQDRLERLVKENEGSKSRLENAINLKNNAMIQLKKDKAKKLQREKEYHGKVADVLEDNQELDSELSVVADRLALLRKELQVKEAGKFTFRELLDKMEKMGEPACPTCNRAFQHKREAEHLKRDLLEYIDQIPGNVSSLEKSVEREETRQAALQRIAPDNHALKQARQDIEELNKQIFGLESDLKQFKSDLASKDQGWAKAAEDWQQTKNVADDVQLIDALSWELEDLVAERQTLKEQLSGQGERGLDQVRQEVKGAGQEVRQLRKEYEEAQDNFNATSKAINELEGACNRLTNEKLEIEGKQQQRSNMMEKKAELERKAEEVKTELNAAKESMEPLQQSLRNKEKDRDAFQREKERELEEMQRKERKVENYQQQLSKLETSIVEYRTGHKADKLEEAKKKKVELEEDLGRQREDRGADEQQLNQINMEDANQDGIRRNLTDNVQLRQLREREEKHSVELDRFRDQLGDTDYSRVETKKNSLLQKLNDIKADIFSKTGKIAEMKRSIKEVELELNQSKLKNAARYYCEASVKYSTRKMAVQDLDQYHRALEFAILRYHSDKMKVVNSIIRDMWRSTYRGNDIDYIEIKTTDEGDTICSADKRKTYNYRVVMVKNDVEMDMRGRCSAGQKVLACLIIRLALAETFAESCGIIALDEPTTNLDRENILGLAEALSSIAARQAEHRDFQVVIITHDEEFIELLSRSDHIQHYQKVSRNSRGISEIRKVNTNQLSDQSSQFNDF